MSEICPFTGRGCHVTPDLQAEGIVCETGKQGEFCGPALALFNVEMQRTAFEELDEQEPIIATFTIKNVPAGQAPEDIRQQWVDVVLPVRNLDRAQGGVVEISPIEAVFALRAAARHEVSEWWYVALRPTVSNPVAMLVKGLAFKSSDGELTELVEPMTSFDFYGHDVADEGLRERLGEYAAASAGWE